jgi:hypothetical protein
MFDAKMPSAIHVAVLLPGTVDLVLLFAAFKLSFVYSNHGLGRMISTGINCSFSLLESMSRNHASGLPLGINRTSILKKKQKKYQTRILDD